MHKVRIPRSWNRDMEEDATVASSVLQSSFEVGNRRPSEWNLDLAVEAAIGRLPICYAAAVGQSLSSFGSLVPFSSLSRCSIRHHKFWRASHNQFHFLECERYPLEDPQTLGFALRMLSNSCLFQWRQVSPFFSAPSCSMATIILFPFRLLLLMVSCFLHSLTLSRFYDHQSVILRFTAAYFDHLAMKGKHHLYSFSWPSHC